MKKYKILLTIIFLALAIAAGVYYFFYIKDNRSIISKVVEEKPLLNKESDKKASNEKTADPSPKPQPKVYPEDYYTMKKAIAGKDISLCDKLINYPKDNCIFDIATQNNDSGFCGRLADIKMKQDCLDYFILGKAAANADFNECLKIKNDNYREQCLKEIFRKQKDLGFCANLKNEVKTICEDTLNYRLAYEKKNSQFCEAISSPALKENCLQLVKTKAPDSDNDGLTDSEELSYGTNPFKADTDSDGFSDIDELRQGYNPNGAGKLGSKK